MASLPQAKTLRAIDAIAPNLQIFRTRISPVPRACGSPKDRPHVIGAISGDPDRSATGIFDAHPNRISDAERLSRQLTPGAASIAPGVTSSAYAA